MTTNLQTQLWIAQGVFTSNIVTLPVVATIPPSTSSARPEHREIRVNPVRR